MKTIDTYNFKDKKVIIRVDFNVAMDGKTITDDTRIRLSLPTIQKVLDDGGSVILLSHLGRPKGEVNLDYSLKPIAKHLEKLLDTEVMFSDNPIGEEAVELSNSLKPGEVLMFENIRFHPGEEQGDEDLSLELSKLGDIYINDAFSVSHRNHSSVSSIASHFPEDKFVGQLLNSEIQNIGNIMGDAGGKFIAVIGGSKVSSKIGVLTTLVEKVDQLIIGGAMAYTFALAKGGEVGKSLVERDFLETALEILKEAEKSGTEILLPVDSINALELAHKVDVVDSPIDMVSVDHMGLDIGPESIELFEKAIAQAGTILWNGPMGAFEFDPFIQGTKSIAKAIAKATDDGAFSLAGGGDSVAAINQFGLQDSISHVSTGGGALLEYIEGRELPGIVVLKRE